MRTLKVTKDQVFDALATEPLQPGQFFRNNLDEEPQWETCKVCAVGAIMRKAGVFSDSVNEIQTELLANMGCASDSCDPDDPFLSNTLSSQEFLAELSQHFEYYADNYLDDLSDDVDYNVRTFCLFFTEAFCPDVLEIEHNLLNYTN